MGRVFNKRMRQQKTNGCKYMHELQRRRKNKLRKGEETCKEKERGKVLWKEKLFWMAPFPPRTGIIQTLECPYALGGEKTEKSPSLVRSDPRTDTDIRKKIRRFCPSPIPSKAN